ncbi:MAG TPA: hypothetical protein VJ875_04460 [Pyrinomonadaceae bacterium]|nr:hypothetical protein [Pyrinomonadaceae bacterium]
MLWRVIFLVCVLGYLGITQAQPLPKNAGTPAFAIRQRAVLPEASGTDKASMALSADGRLLATGIGRGPVKLWDAGSGQLIAELSGTEGQSPHIFSQVDDRLLVSTSLKSVSLYDLNAMKLRWYLKLDNLLGSLNLFRGFSPDGELFIINSEGKGKVTVWETKTARMLASRHCSEPFFKSSFSQDSKTILTSCGGRKSILWDARTGNTIAEFSSPADVLVAMFGPDAESVTTITMNGHVIVWDTASGQMKNSWGRDCQIFYATFSPDRKVLATVGWSGIVDLWDVENQKLSRQLRISRSATHVNFSSDSRFLTANGHTGEVAVWNVADGSPVLNITEHRKDIDYVLFSSDNNLLVSYGADAVNVWDLVSKAHLAKLTEATLPAFLSNDGKLLVTGGQKKTVILWEVTP